MTVRNPFNKPPSGKNRILLIGWDAADWKVAKPLMDAGKMPTLAKMIAEGCHGNLATIQPVLSPMLWTSIATGKRAWKHGIYGFAEPNKDRSGVRPITNLSRKTKAIWNIFNQEGWQNQVIGWWPSHPAEPINGVMVSNHYQRAVAKLGKKWPMQAGAVHPPELAKNLEEMRVHPAELENEHILPFIPNAAKIDQAKDRRMGNCAKTLAEISGTHAAATATLQLEPWDFGAVYYDGIDHFGHGFMKYHPPKLPWISDEDFENYQHVIEAAYRFHDMMLDTLLRIAGEQTTVMLISDHGFEPGNLRPKKMPNEPAAPAFEHSKMGIFCVRGPGIKKGHVINGATLLDVAPTLLHIAEMPIGEDMDGRVLEDCFDGKRTVEKIPSWDDVAGNDGCHPMDKQSENTIDQKEQLQQLVDLGYIDQPDDDASIAVRDAERELSFNLAQAYLDGGKTEEAARLFESLWEEYPELSRFGQRLLGCWLALNDAERARATYDLLMARKKKASEKAREELQQVDTEKLEELSDTEKRKLRGLQAQAKTDLSAVAYFEGRVLALEGHYNAALSSYEKAKEVEPSRRPDLLFRMAEAHRAQENWNQSEALYREALEMDPDNAGILVGLSRLYLKQERPFEAAGNAQLALEKKFNSPIAQCLRGAALLQMKKLRLAEESLLTAVKLKPDYAAAHRHLRTLYKRKKDETKATEHAQILEELESGRSPNLKGLSLPELNEVSNRIGSSTEPLLIVSGLPRSGTSMMMQMLVSGGINALTDDQREADESNPKGYFEHEAIKSLANPSADKNWLYGNEGKVVKVVAPLLKHLPEDIPTRIIFMQRDVNEILRSQDDMLERSGEQGSHMDHETIASHYAKDIESVAHMIGTRDNMELLPLDYADVLNDPLEQARSIAAFLQKDMSPEVMAAVVDPQLYRSRVPD